MCVFVVLVGTGLIPVARGEFWATLVVAFPATGKTFRGRRLYVIYDDRCG